MSLFDNLNKNVAVGQNHGQQSVNFQKEEVFQQPTTSAEVSNLIRNTYMLLSMTLFFSAITAGIAMVIQMAVQI